MTNVNGARAMSPPATAPGHPQDRSRQDIRVAVVLNGGVSLAVWISGVTLELYNPGRCE
jgi:hypothetical protein